MWKKIEVYNSRTDGYNCYDKNRLKIKGNTHLHFCKRCSSNNYTIKIKYEYSETNELYEQNIKEKENAFTWIRITLYCNNCHKKYPNFIDIETD